METNDFYHHERFAPWAAGASIILLLKCPTASSQVWLNVQAVADQAVMVTVFEAPTTNRHGHHRGWKPSRSKPCPVELSAMPSVSNDGTPINYTRFAIKQYQSEPLPLKPGTNYLVRLTNTSGSPADGVLSLGLGVMPNVDYLRAL